MGIMPPDAVTIEINGATGIITGNMSAWTVAPGLRLYPGSNRGTGPNSREIATYTQNGTTGATVTFAGPFDANYAAGTKFYIAEGAPSGSNAYVVTQLQRSTSRLEQMFGPDVSVAADSQQLPLRRYGGGAYARLAFFQGASGTALSFYLTQKSSAGREVLAIQALPDGNQVVDALVVDRATGGVAFRSVETPLASSAAIDLGAAPDRRVHVTGGNNIGSFGSAAHQEKLLSFQQSLTLIHGSGLSLPGAQNLAVTPGAQAVAVSDAAGNWRLAAYFPPRDPNAVGGMSGGAIGGPVTAVTLAADRAVMKATFAEAVATGAAYVYNASDGPLGADGSTWSVNTAGESVNTVAQIAVAYFGPARDRVFVRSRLSADWSAWRELVAGAAGVLDVAASHVAPFSDNAISAGRSAARFSTVYAATGAISTSDARVKTAVVPLSTAEIAWARDLAEEIGSFQFLDAIALKGEEGARLHIGMTVQRAIALGQARGLDPFRYGFICHDAWGAETAVPAGEGLPAQLDADGAEIVPARPASPAVPGLPSGDRYSFRADQLAFFIVRGVCAGLAAQEARLAALEAAIAA